MTVLEVLLEFYEILLQCLDMNKEPYQNMSPTIFLFSLFQTGSGEKQKFSDLVEFSEFLINTLVH